MTKNLPSLARSKLRIKVDQLDYKVVELLVNKHCDRKKVFVKKLANLFEKGLW